MTASWLRCTTLCALLVASTASRALAGELRDLELEVGEQLVLPSQGVSSYSEGTPGFLDVRLTQDGSSFVLVGKRAGRTSLLLMRTDGSEVQYRVWVKDSAAQVARGDEIGPVESRDNVRLDFYFVQLSRDAGANIGVRWPASYGGGAFSAQIDLMAGSFDQATAAITEQALPRLDLAQSAGWAKVLRQAAVITANGTDASFNGGGEINIPVQTALGVGVRQITFGSRVRVRPRYDRESGRIELTIHAEVSDLTSDRGSGMPGRSLSDLDSVVNLELGESLVLAGLTAESESGNKQGLPWLSQLPILGALFGTHAGRSEHTENLIFIVPSVVDSVALDARAHLRTALKILRGYDGDLEHTPLRPHALRIEDRAAPPGAEP